MSEVVTLLRDARKRQGISQSVLAESVGLSLRQISRWETGDDGGKLKGEELLRVIAYLKVPFQEVIDKLDKQAAERLRAEAALTAEEEAMLSRLNPKQRAALLELARQMLQDG